MGSKFQDVLGDFPWEVELIWKTDTSMSNWKIVDIY